MENRDFKALTGISFPIHGVQHTCIAADGDALLLLQHGEDGTPVQYVTAHHPRWHKGELVWDQGDYFPFFHYEDSDTPIAEALRDAAVAATEGKVYVSMANDDLGARCIGVFTREQDANEALEKLIARDGAAAVALQGKQKAYPGRIPEALRRAFPGHRLLG